MSLISSLWKGALGLAKAYIPGVSQVSSAVSAVGRSALGAGGGKGAPAVISGGQQLMRIPTGATRGSTVLPGAGFLGSALAGAAGSAVVGTLMSDGSVKKRRRRRRGISASELKNHARVENFLSKNFKCKSGGSRPSYVKRKR